MPSERPSLASTEGTSATYGSSVHNEYAAAVAQGMASIPTVWAAVILATTQTAVKTTAITVDVEDEDTARSE